jgi:hypothetical protein
MFLFAHIFFGNQFTVVGEVCEFSSSFKYIVIFNNDSFVFVCEIVARNRDNETLKMQIDHLQVFFFSIFLYEK